MGGLPVARDGRALALLAGLLALACALWLFQGLGETRRGFLLGLRGTRLAGLLILGAATGVATVLFQTLAANRVLTPAMMGFDSLFGFVQVLIVSGLGVGGLSAAGGLARFWLAVAAMLALALALFVPLLGRGGRDVPRMILTGLILGVLFRSLSGFLTRVMDPNAFAVVQSLSAASLSRIDPSVLPWAGAMTAASVAAALALSRQFDVLALGRQHAVSLGLRVGALTVGGLALVALMTAAATAMAGSLAAGSPIGGPAAFFGLIAAGLARGLTGSARHAVLLPAAALVAMLVLVLGQILFERVLGLAGTLSVVIEFAGGLFFLALLLKGRLR